MSVYGIVLFVIGVLFVLTGAGLILYGTLARRSAAEGKAKTTSTDGNLKVILDFVLEVLKFLASLFPGEKTSQAGLAFIVIGVGLIILPFILHI
ncbi:MAG: hypothetical protein ONB11_06365 [candidate division KSB1 bacterium]|nr:hypothetical protein [candidate division KSB1 bacterium]